MLKWIINFSLKNRLLVCVLAAALVVIGGRSLSVLPIDAFPDTTPVRLETIDGVEVLKVQPWHFMKKVLKLWQQNMTLLTQSQTFPWGKITEK